MGILAAILLTLGLFAYVFWPQRDSLDTSAPSAKTRADYLRERKEAIDANLRDLNFEHQAGKYPEEDYLAQKTSLDNEAARVTAELEAPERRSV